jgi:magnesium-transporting ATPase (P-type)
MCKGADSTMLDLCKMDEVSRKSVDKSLLDLACFGLRTLCIAHKKLSPEAAKVLFIVCMLTLLCLWLVCIFVY